MNQRNAQKYFEQYFSSAVVFYNVTSDEAYRAGSLVLDETV